jgi:hypothetical protein
MTSRSQANRLNWFAAAEPWPRTVRAASMPNCLRFAAAALGNPNLEGEPTCPMGRIAKLGTSL